jgi:SAM-dependent methyltransferase
MSPVLRATRSVEPDYVSRNRAAWDRWAPYYEAAGRRGWAQEEPRWGMWGTPESELGLLSQFEPGMDVVELGCGTAFVSAWLAREGLRPVGVDISPRQLETALYLQRQFGVDFRIELENAESIPYESASFDVAISEYGASVWCDPYRWIPEAARLVKPGGFLVFFVPGALLMACTPPTGGAVAERLQRPYFEMHRFEFGPDDAVEFYLGHGDWFSVLRENGFAVENLVEVRAEPQTTPRYDFVSAAWARNWPSEEIWTARRI